MSQRDTRPMEREFPACRTLALNLRDGVLWLTLNRPESRNALSDEMVDELMAVVSVLGERRTVRAVVIRGAGGTFCAGGDIRGFRASFETPAPPPGETDPIARHNRRFGAFMTAFNALPQTVVAVVEGAAFGGGLGLVCASDVALCLHATRFALSETGLGIPPAQIAPFVLQRIGLTQARRLALTGTRFDGREAQRIGLVHHSFEDEAALEEGLAAVLAAIGRCAPGANAATKRILFDSLTLPLPEALDRAAEAFAACLRGAEGREGVQAFLEKRTPAWVPKT